MSPSGSELLEPSRVTVVPTLADWSVPARAVGARFGVTVTVTVSVSVRVPSLTVRVNTRLVLVVTVGAVNVGDAVVAPVSVTAGVPLVWAHDQVRVSPASGSELPEPSRVTVVPTFAVWSAPAFAVGAWFAPQVVAAMSVHGTPAVGLSPWVQYAAR